MIHAFAFFSITVAFYVSRLRLVHFLNDHFWSNLLRPFTFYHVLVFSILTNIILNIISVIFLS